MCGTGWSLISYVQMGHPGRYAGPGPRELETWSMHALQESTAGVCATPHNIVLVMILSLNLLNDVSSVHVIALLTC